MSTQTTPRDEVDELLEVVATAQRALGAARRRLEEQQRTTDGQLTLPVETTPSEKSA